MSKYVPPHLRTQTAAPSAAVEPSVEESSAAAGGSMTDWLREAQKGYVPKTAEQIRQECLQMNFTQLKSRAGPPPPISSEDFGGIHEQGGETEGARTCNRFDGDIRFFKLNPSRCPPPEPLAFTGRDDGDERGDGEGGSVYLGLSEAQKRRRAYRDWYTQWGERLTYLWYKEHPLAPPPQKKQTEIRRAEKEEKAPTRGALAAAAATQICEKSGW